MKYLLSAIVMLCMFTVTFSQPSPWFSEQAAANLVVQPTMSVRGDSLKSTTNFTANKWTPVHNGKAVVNCRGAVVIPTGSAGYLAVHLVFDPAGIWYKMYLGNDGIPVGALFDAVGDSTKGTTVKLDTNLFIFNGLYKQ
jgi:hypothetical protein